MKNKTSILVGTRHFFYALLVAVIFCGCEDRPPMQTEARGTDDRNYQTIVIDSCEYINRYEGGHAGYRFTHKGNCKFCAERSKK